MNLTFKIYRDIIEQQKGCDVMSVKVEVWGDYACFSRPELKTEKFTYSRLTKARKKGYNIRSE